MGVSPLFDIKSPTAKMKMFKRVKKRLGLGKSSLTFILFINLFFLEFLQEILSISKLVNVYILFFKSILYLA